MQKSWKGDIHSTHAFLLCLSSHIVTIILMLAVTLVCIETGLWGPSLGAGSSSQCTHEAFFIPKEFTSPHYLHWKSVESHQLKTWLRVMPETLCVFSA